MTIDSIKSALCSKDDPKNPLCMELDDDKINTTAFTSASMVHELSETPVFWFSLGGMFFQVLWALFLLGFLVSVIVSYQTALEPGMLLKIGRKFFWRTFRFSIVYGAFCMALNMVICTVVKSLFFPSTAFELLPTWVIELCSIPAYIILAKPLILVPCIMIIGNKMLLEATALISQFAILKAKALLAIFIATASLEGLISALQLFMDHEKIAFNVVIAVKGCLMGSLILLAGLYGVWFVNGGKFSKDAETELELSEAL